MTSPIVSIIIPTWNEQEKTTRCFSSILASTDLPYEVIWVDNGSIPGMYAAIKKHSSRFGERLNSIRLQANVGFVKATNIGIRAASPSTKYIILLNNDTEVTAGWVNKLVAPLKDPTIGAVGPITQSELAWQAANHLNRRWHLGLPAFNQPTITRNISNLIAQYGSALTAKFKEKYVETHGNPLSFFCVALAKATINKIGILDEDFGMGLGDDDEYCYRLRAHGYKLLISLGTFVYHWHRTTFNALKLPVDNIRRTNIRLLKEKKNKIDKELRPNG
jgi:GT2 family glycosyltransferase